MQEEIVISQRARRFALGHGDDFYGVWQIRPTELVLVERWPRNAAGWYRAWARLNELEASSGLPSDVVPRPTEIPRFPASAVAILVVGVAAGIASLFPAYLGGVSLSSQSDQLVEHVLFFAGWAAVLVMATRGGQSRPAGAAFGVGLSVMAFGFYLGDLGSVIASGAHVAGAGLWLGILGWLLCTAGCLVAAVRLRGTQGLGRPVRRKPLVVAVAAVASIGLAVSFAPSWDSYRLYAALTGEANTVTAGNAFANPAPVVAADVVIMVLIVVLALAAVLWEPLLVGATLLAGALVPMVAQFVSALVQATPVPSAFGISQAEATQLHLQISSGFTPIFWVYGAFGVALVVLCVARLQRARSAADGLHTVRLAPIEPAAR